MPLTIIKGPPNSGRTELVRERYRSRLAEDPVLVVPSTDDIFGWERRLTRHRGAFLGGKVVHFQDLVDLILGDQSADRKSGGAPTVASPLRRRALAAGAIRAEWPAIAGRLEEQPGLIDAALRTIDEFRANLIGVDRFDDLAELVGPIARVYRGYLDAMDAAGLTDLPARAVLAATRSQDRWQGRPVFMTGFDDLSAQQLELIRRLSRQTDVTIAITHEKGNRAMAITEALLGNLESIGGTVETETERPASPPDHAPSLVELERAFLDPAATGTLEPDAAVNLIEASGRRGEAEAIGSEIARLLDGGTDPGEIAIAVDAPALNGGPILDLLTEYGIPATIEAETKAPETATGQAVINLLRAGSPAGDAGSFYAFLRGPLGLERLEVDRVEFEAVRKGAETALEVKSVADCHRLDLPGFDKLRDGEVAEAVRAVALRAARTLVGLRPEALPDSSMATETQMATAICRALDELQALHSAKLTPDLVLDALLSGVVKTWAVPRAHTVRIASPYSMRAKRAGYVFIASLQEKDLAGREGSPLISQAARSALEMPDLADPEDQETYLFYSCLAVPTKGLWLSCRIADVHGKAEFPSPLIDEVGRLFFDRGSGLNRIRRSDGDIVFPAGQAPSVHELALSAAASVESPTELASFDDAAAAVRHARRIEESTASLGDVDSEAARAGLAERNLFSATALEAFIECPYRWFFEKAMSPGRFGPDPEAMAKGNLVHEVLTALYRGHPGELPTPDTLRQWIDETESLIEDLAGRCGLGKGTAPHRIQRRQVAIEIERYLRREARRSTTYAPIGFERKFGFEEEGSMPALNDGGWQLRGVIDRIDRGPVGGGPGSERDPRESGVVIDYKSGASAYRTLAEMKREGKVQLHLYLRALDELWGLDPAAGLYVPIFAAQKNARGLVDRARAEDIGVTDLVSHDLVEDIEVEIEAGFELASIAAGKILRGEIAHDSTDCLNHFAHAGVPDWTPDPSADNGGAGK